MFFPPPSPFFLLGNPPPLYPSTLAIPPPPSGMFFALPPAPPVVDVQTLVVKEVDVQITKTKTRSKPNKVKPKAEPKKEEKAKKDKDKKKKQKPNTRAPGTAYIFPKHHTSLNIIRDIKIWENGQDVNFRYKCFNVGTSKSVGGLIEYLTGDEGEGWAITEVIEVGDGVFCRDVTIEYGGDLAKKDLASLGWNQERNKCRPPVWLVLHKNE